MSRASRARRIASAAMYGGGGLGAIGALGWGLLVAQATHARRRIGQPFHERIPQPDGVYGAGATPIRLALLGDSSAVGLGVDEATESTGAMLASLLATQANRPVDLKVLAVVGAVSADLDGQIDRLMAGGAPDVAVIMIGANDVTHRFAPSTAVRYLSAAVQRLRDADIPVVVGTCPDLGTIRPIPVPLRHVARLWSRQLATAQTIGVVQAGGRTVSLADLLGEEFRARQRELFSSDGFHPSAEGYAHLAAALLPSVLEALALPAPSARPSVTVDPDSRSVAKAAAHASRKGGRRIVGDATPASGLPLGEADHGTGTVPHRVTGK